MIMLPAVKPSSASLCHSLVPVDMLLSFYQVIFVSTINELNNIATEASLIIG